MAAWSLTNKPNWVGNAIQTDSGWVNPVTGEILVAIGRLPKKRQKFLDGNTNNLILEDGGLFVLEQDLDSNQTPDYLSLD